MTHQEFCYAFFSLGNGIEKFLESQSEYDINRKEFQYLLLAFYTDMISTKNYPNVQSIFRRLIDAGLLFKIKDEGTVIGSISTKGIFFVNEMFAFLDKDFDQFGEDYPLKDRAKFIRKNFFTSTKGKKRIVAK